MRRWLAGMTPGEVAIDLALGTGLWFGTSLVSFAALVSL